MADVTDLDGSDTGTTELPRQFDERVRPDIIKKAVEVAQANRRQPYGSDKQAGLKHVTHWKKRSRAYRGIRGRSYPSSRTPRKITFRRGMQMSGPGGEAPQAVGGRRAHPPKGTKNWSQDINTKERRKAIRSAIAATTDLDTVQERGHRVDRELPIIVDGAVEALEHTADVEELLKALGLEAELERVREPQRRAGKGKGRGRTTRTRTGPLFVVDQDDGLKRAARNIPGVEVATADELSAELLAPGAQPGRLTVWSENAVERMDEEGLFR